MKLIFVNRFITLLNFLHLYLHIKIENLNLHIKNDKGITLSKQYLSSNYTDIDGLFLEQLENSYHTKENLKYSNSYINRINSSNSDLQPPPHISQSNITQSSIINLPSLNQSNSSEDYIMTGIDNYINEAKDSLELNLKDIEFNMFRININLRKLYNFNTHSIKGVLDSNNRNENFNRFHSEELEKFLFEKFLEKI